MYALKFMLASLKLNSPLRPSKPDAETVAALAAAAETKVGAERLEACADEMDIDLGAAVAGLVKSSRVEVAYHGARLAKQLVVHANPACAIVIKTAAEECLCRDTTNRILRAELRHVIGGR